MQFDTRMLGPYAKRDRAYYHRIRLGELVAEFLASTPYQTEGAVDPDTGDWIVRVRLPRRPTVEMSTVLGDVIHNLRTSLDLTLCAAIRARGNQVTDQTSFPFYGNEQEFRQHVSRRMTGTSRAVFDLVRELEPYQGGKGDQLWRLHKLDIEDKHRLLIPVGSRLRHVAVVCLRVVRPGFVNGGRRRRRSRLWTSSCCSIRQTAFIH